MGVQAPEPQPPDIRKIDPRETLTLDVGTNIACNSQSVSVRLLAIQQQLKLQSKFPVGGRLKFFWQQWLKLGAPKSVVKWLRRGYPLPFSKEKGGEAAVKLTPECPQGLVTQYASGSEKQIALDNKIQELLDKQVIAQAPENEMAFHNRVFLRPKRTGGWRLILDVSQLNKFLHWDTFKMDHIAVIRESAEHGMFATSVDFSDAYHHIPIRRGHVRFLCFQVGNKRYWYLALPFGLSPAPRIFTVVLRPLKLWARARLMRLFQYLDDWLNLARSQAHAREQTLCFVEKCVELGLLVNLEKSELEPTQTIDFLGFTLNFISGRIFPQRAKLLRLRSRLQLIVRKKVVSVAKAESLRGTLTSLEKAVPLGRLHFRFFQRQVSQALRKGREREAHIILSREAQADLSWWAKPENTEVGCPFVEAPHSVTLQTDASTSGWGAYVGTRVLQGDWSNEQRRQHINVLEMRAVLLAFQKLSQQLQGQTVLCLIDNMTVVAYLNRQGGTRSLVLLKLAKHVLLLARSMNCKIVARHLKGALNVVADLASRSRCIISTEWRLTDDAFQWVLQNSALGPPCLELFANRLNKHLSSYCSPCPDSQAVLIDALTATWPRTVLYAFPPATIMSQTIAKMKQESGARVLLVAPRSSTRPALPLQKTP